ncbi:MAG: mediator of RNA polymerase II transcription subunit 8 [Chaenotheca gracillima]|nr:MAG: mediator of RNA polymerase II transcription subunit 8 [Chaenotheca gracillima]
MTALPPSDLKTLEQTRQRLFQLTNALNSLQAQIVNSDPLPPWPSLQSRASIISGTLYTLSRHLNANADLLASTPVHPLGHFPGRAQHQLLVELLRKKPEPGVVEWMDKGRQIGKGGAVNGEEGVDLDMLTQLWEWAPGVMRRSKKRKAVQKSLGMAADEDDEDDDEEDDEDEAASEGEGEQGQEEDKNEDEEMRDIGDEGGARNEDSSLALGGARPMRIEDWMKFVSTGSLPPDRATGI